MAARRPEPTTLTGDRVLLRPLVASDLDELWRTCGSSEVFAWVWPYRMDDRRAMESFVDRALDDASEGVRVPFAQVDRGTGAVVGSTSFLDLDVENRNVEIGWTVLSSSVWRSGFNVEAKLLLLAHAFDDLGMERVAFKTDHLNARSQGALAALGAVREGALRHRVLRADGTWRDSVYFSLLAGEWPAVQARLRQRLADAGPGGG